MLQDFYMLFGMNAVVIFCYMILWFIVSLIVRRNDIADIAWGLGFIIVAWVSWSMRMNEVLSPILLFVVGIWGFRLATHIYLRNRTKKEDKRYKKWREEWGDSFLVRSFFQVFMLQGFLLLLVSLPVMIAALKNNYDLRFLVVGFTVWIIGFFFESVGDYQLSQFLSDPNNKGRIMTSGLWAYTRHPNYFGEVTQWWGIWLMILPVSLWWIALLGPLTITVLILKISGIPMLEKHWQTNKEFQVYKKKTSAFFPMPPRGN